jgi:tetratricopeptide (TPR) repeat protein
MLYGPRAQSRVGWLEQATEAFRRAVPLTRGRKARLNLAAPSARVRPTRREAMEQAAAAAATRRRSVARALMEQGRLQEAGAALEQAVAADPESADVRLALARVRLREGRDDEALAALGSVLELAADGDAAVSTVVGALARAGRPTWCRRCSRTHAASGSRPWPITEASA